ncbi:MAG: carbonic anhydrase family protein [Caldilineaceae bacterium]|nr:carbonic anhydrase family protein [Caldilineaceae bacterium]
MSQRRISIMMAALILMLLQTGTVFANEIHWSYDGDTGPAYWGELSPDWALCGSGESQSPIDIPSSAASNPADLMPIYGPSALTIFNNGHTVQVNYDAGSTLELDGETYELLQFHFHASSEHTVNGVARPMEMHLVHANEDGDLAVVGVFLEEGADNAVFAPIFDNMPAEESEPEAVADVMVNADDLLPTTQTYWRYSGSLTTPNCAENVKWVVMNTPVEVGADQIGTYTAIYDHNARPTQPMNDRAFMVGPQMEEPAMEEPAMEEPATEEPATEEPAMEEPDMLPETGGPASDVLNLAAVAGVLMLLGGATSVSAYRRRLQ